MHLLVLDPVLQEHQDDEDDQEDGEDLAPEDFGRGHGQPSKRSFIRKERERDSDFNGYDALIVFKRAMA